MIIHPALLQLLRLQSRGRRRRIVTRLRQPRRLLLSLVAVLLAVVWLGNAALTVWLREKGSPETLHALLTMGLVIYAGWHVSRAAFFRPENPLEGETAEHELLASLPLAPHDLVAYQLASITVTTLFKAGLFALMLLPDLQSVPLGLYGVFLAMFFLEMIRMTVEIAAWSMNRGLYLLYRTTVVTVLLTLGVGVANAAFAQGLIVHSQDDSVFRPLVVIVMQLNASVFSFLSLPFVPFVNLILADGLSSFHLMHALLLSGAMLAMTLGIVLFYVAVRNQTIRRERQQYLLADIAKPAKADRARESSGQSAFGTRWLQLFLRWRSVGVGPLSWRHFLGAKKHAGGVLTALIAPAVFACIPLVVIHNAHLAWLATAGALAFYSFILLPTALRFDFHRDLSRLIVLKGLPVSSTATVVGQILAPVVIATLFQFVVLAFASVVRSIPPQFLLGAMLIFIPTNTLIFALENLIYLLYPYRVQQEGLEVFLRTMLTFTGKGLMFTFGVLALSVWGIQAATLAARMQQWTGSPMSPGLVFAAGLVFALTALATLAVSALSRTFDQLDPIEDIPR